MGNARPTVARRQLGLTLRRLREQARRSQTQAGNAIGRTAAKISQVENGVAAMAVEDLTTLLDYFEVDEHERETVLSLGVEARRRSRRRTYTDNLPGSFQRLSDLEADAAEICSYEPGIIPGLAQSPDYLREVIRSCDGVWWESSEVEVEKRVAFRERQQRRVFAVSPPKRLAFVVGEDALHHEVGSPSVMRGQILHMLQLMEGHPHLTVQVVPKETKSNPLLGGGIIVLGFDVAPRIGCATVIFGPCTYYDSEEDTSSLMRAFRRSTEIALTVDESRYLLLRYLKESWA
ncbi:helix-turn-helix transcriptional regulator [Nocardiopsis rhodophaea]|uniref:Helix-turn-helix transcriptional regulator n=1 Tax=Nocardiopsis rhodophaea TaxID=280238 RepID=A0ABP5EI97_9ACTN